MPNNWKKYKLGDLIDVKHGYAFKGEFFSEIPTKDILLSPGNFNIGGGFKTDKFKYYDGIVPSDYILKENDVIITMTDLSPKGDTLGTTAKIPKHNGINYLHNQRLGLVIFKSDSISNDYLYWALRNDNYHNFIVSSATGSTVKHTSPSRIKEYEINLPSIIEQQAIAEILSSLDDKIELNLQTNKTLEEMANALYKHWFVDFGPFKNGNFIESELGMIPEGWEIKELRHVAEIIMGQSPESKFYNENSEGLPFHQGVSDYGIRFPSDKIYSTEGNRNAEEGDILFSVRAPVGKINLAKHKIILGRGLAAIRDRSNNNNFLFCSIRNQFKTLDSIGSGTVYNSVNKLDMEKINILTPSDEIKKSFNEIIKILDIQYLNNDSENITLKQTRDYLLPKLISGEVRVKDAVKKIKELV